MTLGSDSAAADLNSVRRYLLLAIISPLLILSHFSTSFSHWHPVHLDLRFGSAIIIPAAVLAADACENLTRLRFSRLTKLASISALLISAFFLALGMLQHNSWTIAGAGASLVVSVAILNAQRWPNYLLATLLVMILSLNWGYYIRHDYRDVMAQYSRMRIEAEAVPWDPDIPVLTDSVTAQYLPYLNSFTSEPKVARWKGEGEISPPFQWADQRDAPWPGKYILVWYPQRAYFQTRRWGGNLPQWVLDQAAAGKLLHQFPSDSAESTHNVFDRRRTRSNEYLTWPRAGIYLINGQS